MMTLTMEQFNENPHGDSFGLAKARLEGNPKKAYAGGCKKSVHKRVGWDKMGSAT